MAREYANEFTLDGRLHVQPGVTKEKVARVSELIDGTLSGNRIDKGFLEESITTSDAVFNFAHVANREVLRNFPDRERVWSSLISGTRTVGDFRPATLYSINPDWAETSKVLGPRVISPVIPEGTEYPYAYFKPEEARASSGLRKRGFRTGFTFEAFINDSIGFLSALPSTMEKVALDTEEAIVYDALFDALTSANELKGGAIPDGSTTVPANAALSREALIRAIIEISNREINGRKVVLSGGFKLVVPAGVGEFVRFILAPTLTGMDSGGYKFTINGYDPLAGVTVIESTFVPADSWILMPNANSAGRPVLELFKLAGHELPELRVENATGNYTGGSAVAPFEGSFLNDTVDFRIRQILDAHVWTPELILHSDGTGS